LTELTARQPISERASAYSRDRIITLSDGVFAIAITLLVLDVVPKIPSEITGSDLARELLAFWPKLVAYGLSFLVIGGFWDYHRTYFRFIHVADGRAVWANLNVLLWITLIPASAALLGSHIRESGALILYSLNLLLAILALWLLWRYASSAGYLQREGLHERVGHYIDRFTAVSVLGYGLAVPAAFGAPYAALALVLLTTTLARWAARRVLIVGVERG
jgi:TMEM175 potassium channel family protein